MRISEVVQLIAATCAVLATVIGGYVKLFRTPGEVADKWSRSINNVANVLQESINVGGLTNPWMIGREVVNFKELSQEILVIAGATRSFKIKRLAEELNLRLSDVWAKSPQIPPTVHTMDEFGNLLGNEYFETYRPMLDNQVRVAREGLKIAERLNKQISQRRTKH